METNELKSPCATEVIPVRVAALTNILLNHNVAVMERLSCRVQKLRLFLSASNEPDRMNRAHWGGLDVVLQKAWRRSYEFRNDLGFQDTRHLHIPYDTFLKLWRYRPDVIISGQFGARTLQASLYKLLRPRTILIVWATLSQRTESTRGRLRVRLRRWVLGRADGCFTHGQDGEIYLRNLGFRRPVFHTPYAADAARVAPSYSPSVSGPRRLLCLGQLIERKGVLPFIRALATWCRANPALQVRLTLGGEGPLRSVLETVQLPGNLLVRLVGHMNSQQMDEAYRETDIFVFPTLADEWGMVVNEALCAGIPMLASMHAQAAAELVQHGVNGWLFDPEAEDSMFAALDRALNMNMESLQQISKAAHATMAGHTPQVMAERMAGAIAVLARGSRCRG